MCVDCGREGGREGKESAVAATSPGLSHSLNRNRKWGTWLMDILKGYCLIFLKFLLVFLPASIGL